MRKAVCTAVLALAILAGAATQAVAQTYPPEPGSGTLTGSSSVVVPGGTITISGSGASPGATVTITFASTPVVLGTTTADAEGAFSATVTIPTSAEAGEHTVSAISEGVVLATLTLRVVATSAVQEDEDELAFTGVNALLKIGVGVGSILVGAVLLLVLRRRRRATASA
jgi:hypothetical protein